MTPRVSRCRNILQSDSLRSRASGEQAGGDDQGHRTNDSLRQHPETMRVSGAEESGLFLEDRWCGNSRRRDLPVAQFREI